MENLKTRVFMSEVEVCFFHCMQRRRGVPYSRWRIPKGGRHLRVYRDL